MGGRKNEVAQSGAGGTRYGLAEGARATRAGTIVGTNASACAWAQGHLHGPLLQPESWPVGDVPNACAAAGRAPSLAWAPSRARTASLI